MFFSVYTLGCKVNQLETEAIADSFCRQGFSLIPWDLLSARSGEDLNPLVLIVNTCTVTSMAEQKARRVIRKALKEQPKALVIVTGCYAQMDADALAALEEGSRLFVIPGGKKDRLLDLPRLLVQASSSFASSSFSFMEEKLKGYMKSPEYSDSSEVKNASFRFSPEKFSSHSRAFIKIQDGCDRRCSYCRVPLARGKSRSLDAKEVLKQLILLEEQGFAEAVLTGVNISQYQDPLCPGLPSLLDFLLIGTAKIRLRLSSIELDSELDSDLDSAAVGLGDAFIEVIANPRIRPHFHLSLQSGSAGILAKMGRAYSPQDIERITSLLQQAKGDPFLACDIIAGFPGESEKDFKETFELCEKIGFAWIHAFPFSPRPGTAAFGLPEKVAEKEKTTRVKLLSGLAKNGRLEYIRRWEGKEVEAVVEKGALPGKGFVPAVSENYLKLRVDCGEKPLPAPGSLIQCRIMKADDSNFDAAAEWA